MLFRLYIGSNNETKELEKEKAIRILSARFEGFTASLGNGYWNGKPEKSLIIEIEAEKQDILDTAKVLAIELKQEAIGVAEIGKMSFVS